MSNEEKILELLTQMQTDISTLKSGQQEIRTDITGIKDRLDRVEDRAQRTAVLLETEVDRKLDLLYDGHDAIMERLDKLASRGRVEELEAWLRSYKPEELFNSDGTPVELVASFPPAGNRRMGANPHANGGLLLRDLRTPDFRDYAVDITVPGGVEAQRARLEAEGHTVVQRGRKHLRWYVQDYEKVLVELN